MKESYESAEFCLETNYYGAKSMVEAHVDLLKLSDSPRIVNVSSSMGKLEVLYLDCWGRVAETPLSMSLSMLLRQLSLISGFILRRTLLMNGRDGSSATWRI